VRAAIDDVRALAERIYPPLLGGRGLAATLRAAASNAGIPTRVEAAGLGRCPPEVAAAVYFCCFEALRNAAAHAGAGAHATIALRREESAIFFQVVDDGAGFAPEATVPAGGLTQIRARVDALGGELTVVSEPGRGTRVTGTIPLLS